MQSISIPTRATIRHGGIRIDFKNEEKKGVHQLARQHMFVVRLLACTFRRRGGCWSWLVVCHLFPNK